MELCKVEGCGNGALTRGYCRKHYEQIRKYGRLTPEKEKGYNKIQKVCLAEGCDKAAVTKGYCHNHYRQINTYGRLTPERERVLQGSDDKRKCSIEGCNGKYHAKGFCHKHYMLFRNKDNNEFKKGQKQINNTRSNIEDKISEMRKKIRYNTCMKQRKLYMGGYSTNAENKQIWNCNFSYDENWTDDDNFFDTVDEAIDYGKKQVLVRREEDGQDYESFQVGRLTFYVPEVKVNEYDVLKNIIIYADHKYGDTAEFFLDGIEKKDINKLGAVLNEAVKGWLEQLDISNKLVNISDIQEIVID